MTSRDLQTSRLGLLRLVPIPAGSTANVTATAAATTVSAGSGRQRRVTAKRALEILQNLPDAGSGRDVDESEANEENG